MSSPSPKPVRWQVGVRIAILGLAAVIWAHWHEEWPFQKRNLIGDEIIIVTVIALGIWWLFLSRAAWRLRWQVVGGVVGLVVVFFSLVRIRGMSGDMVPIAEWRWGQVQALVPAASTAAPATQAVPTTDFTQLYGPDRKGVFAGPKLDADWSAHPPQEVWRRPIGAGWSGFVVTGDLCITQEQQGEDECVSAFTLATGEPRWTHKDPARHYKSLIAGEGPRATPTIAGGKVLTLGSTGLLNALDLATGSRLWSQDTVAAVNGQPPQWGAASSPLVVEDLVIVHGGEHGSHSLIAYHTKDGSLAWKGGTRSSYASPVFATLAGVPQIVAFNDGSVSAHDPKTGATLWQQPWGNGNVVCACPLVIGDDQVLFSSGYGVGAELFTIAHEGAGLKAVSQWKSTRMKAKFAQLFSRDGCVFGLDDGLLACADLKDGSRHWRDGRYGHGQGLVIGDHYVLMAENGDLVLLHPTPEAPNELARVSVLKSKTWNPVALTGDLVLVRNDREAVCLRLAVVK